MNTQTAIFGGGCFWCTEAIFARLKGVQSVLPGYSGGNVDNPTYEQVSSGESNHVEVTKVEFDADTISYEELLDVFFHTHDPTSLNRQGADVGTQYRSAIFYTNEEQKKIAQKFIEHLQDTNEFGKSIVTTLDPFTEFYEAEDYHKNYFETHPNAGYCQIVIAPKIHKLEKMYGEKLKR